MDAIHTALPGLFYPMPLFMQLWLIGGLICLLILRRASR